MDLGLALIDFAVGFRGWMLAVFHKEALFIFSLLCLAFFIVACLLVKWGFQTGEFKDLENAKFEMMDT